jgi:soluble lytic murein transglycosylase-like protein
MSTDQHSLSRARKPVVGIAMVGLTTLLPLLFVTSANLPVVGIPSASGGLERVRLETLLSQRAAAPLAGDLAHGILVESGKHGLDPVLILALIEVESQFDHDAESPRGAQGLMQIKPVVLGELFQEGKLSGDADLNLKNPLINIRVGVSYLAYLSEIFGDVRVALTAYNFGPTRIRRKLAAGERLPTEYATKVLGVQQALLEQLASSDLSRVGPT